jgi:1,4-dihydroxy-2-naphthoate octaprenyltransferase
MLVLTSQIQAVVGTARPNFLTLTPACVFLGLAAALGMAPDALGYSLLPLAFLGAVLGHASVNILNEYEDFRSGLDGRTIRTPFSGGSGTLPSDPEGAAAARLAGYATLAGTVAVGLGLVVLRGVELLPLGILGALVVALYSSHIVRWPLASLVAPGMGFGPVMVLGTAFVLSGEYTSEAVIASFVPFFLVSNLLLLNQFPDVEADSTVGRSNLPILLGRRRSAWVYALFLAGAFGTILLGIAFAVLPFASALALLPALGAPLLARGVYRHADDIERLTPLLGWNVGLTLSTIVLLGLGLLLG